MRQLLADFVSPAINHIVVVHTVPYSTFGELVAIIQTTCSVYHAVAHVSRALSKQMTQTH